MAVMKAEHVVKHEHLSVRVRTGPDADGGTSDVLGDHLSEYVGYSFEDHRKDSGLVERLCVGKQRLGRLGTLALHPVATHRMHRLGGEADVTHHGDLGIENRLDVRHPFDAPLQLDRLCPALPNEPTGVADGVLWAHMEAHPGHVADDERIRLGAGHSRRVVDHDIHIHGNRRLVPEHDIGERISNEDDVGPGFGGDRRRGCVVGGHHRDVLAALAGPDGGRRDLLAAHCCSFSPPGGLGDAALRQRVRSAVCSSAHLPSGQASVIQCNDGVGVVSSGVQTSDVRHRTSDSGQRTADSG